MGLYSQIIKVKGPSYRIGIWQYTSNSRTRNLSSYINSILFTDGQINGKIKLDTKAVFKTLY
jgi:hypothetical protein